MFWLSVTIILLLLYAALFFYYTKEWNKLPCFKPKSKTDDYRYISVIVPARNEEKNISALLAALSQQTYPKEFFEIIVLDDFSTDATAQMVKEFPLPNLRLLQPASTPGLSSKKKAIETGIQNAKGELIVTTDADCIPSQNWLSIMNAFFVTTNAAFIAAPVKFLHNESFLQIFQTIDFLTLQGITAASVSSNFHSLCNGANLAYKKEAFYEVRGFEGIDKVATGDDMLLLYKIWKKYPGRVFYLRSTDAIVTTQPMYTWKQFYRQRKRWASKSLIYDDYRIITVLALVLVVNFFFTGLMIAALFDNLYWWYVLGFWITKTIIELPFVYSVARFYNEQKLMKYFFFFQPVHCLYTVIVGVLSQFGQYEWKGRKTK